MGFTGSIAIFTEQPIGDPAACLRELLASCHIDGIYTVSRAVWPGVRDGTIEYLADEQCRHESLQPPHTPERIVEFFDPGRCLTIYASSEAWTSQVAREIRQVPAEVRGNFDPWELFISIGPHDLVEHVNELRLFGRAQFSVSVSGGGSPLHWTKARELLTELPSVRALAARLEPIIGPTKICAYWDG